MEINNDLRAAIDRARLMVRLSLIAGFLTLLLLILVVVLGFVKADFAGSDTFALALLPLLLALLFSAGAVIYGVLAGAAAREEEEKALLVKRKDNRALNTDEDVRFTAGRTFALYRRFAPYVISVLALLILGGLLYLFGSQWSFRGENRIPPANALHAALAATILMLLAAFSGAFYTGQGRARDFGWLKAVGAWLTASAAVLLCAAVAAICNRFNLASSDLKIAWVLFWLTAVLGGEILLNMIVEFYRPRSIVESRPIFESRLLALFTEPGGVVRNIALALDYQFGFKVSGTWIYSFLEKSFFPVLIFWLLLLWGFTAIHEVGPSEVGVKERLGKVVSAKPLPPGIYCTLPWPFGRVNRYSCTELRSIVIGEMASGERGADGKKDKKDDKKKPSQVVTWTNMHGGENEHYIVAVPDANSEVSSISFLRLTIPIQFRIRPDGVMKFAYGNASPVKALKCISEEVATEYMASVAMMELMSSQRSLAERSMRERIQKRADDCGLGIEVVSVIITGAHPPIERVAPAFQEVIGAMEQKETAILDAEAYSLKTLPESVAAAEELIENAKAYYASTRTVAGAEAERFKSQLVTFNAMPRMFKLRGFLGFLEQDCKDMRKFVLTSKADTDVYQFNFEAKERLDLIDTDVSKIKL